MLAAAMGHAMNATMGVCCEYSTRHDHARCGPSNAPRSSPMPSLAALPLRCRPTLHSSWNWHARHWYAACAGEGGTSPR